MVLSSDGTKDGLRWQVKADCGASPAWLQRSQPCDEAKDHDGSSQFDRHARADTCERNSFVGKVRCALDNWNEPEPVQRRKGAPPDRQLQAKNAPGVFQDNRPRHYDIFMPSSCER